MKELLEYLIKSLVDYPDEVEVQPVEGERTVIFEVRVAPDDMGKVIGKHGKIANALRTILKAAATKDGKKVSMEIIS
ncbi:MAG: KH domain-containing protein [bacterium]|nr:KH domain-containing protein [bacterium]MDD3806210.1 KH domain-containing protein [bacterium]MDD4558754.1 KH domain-containing protein [bacterium]